MTPNHWQRQPMNAFHDGSPYRPSFKPPPPPPRDNPRDVALAWAALVMSQALWALLIVWLA
jgi:hypothetical protein